MDEQHERHLRRKAIRLHVQGLPVARILKVVQRRKAWFKNGHIVSNKAELPVSKVTRGSRIINRVPLSICTARPARYWCRSTISRLMRQSVLTHFDADATLPAIENCSPASIIHQYA